MIVYTPEHEWLDDKGDDVAVGITEHAAQELGDIVYLELPEVGARVGKGEEIVVIESVKAASDISAPVSGVVTAVNEALAESPGDVNANPMAAWFLRIQPDNREDLDGLLDEAAYQELIG